MRSASNYPYVLDTIVCYPPTFQNLVPLNPDEHTPLDLQITSLSQARLGMTLMYEIGTFCAVGGRHNCALFCVKGEGFHTHLTTSRSDSVQLGASLFYRVLLLSRAAAASLSDELLSVEGSSAFGLVAFKKSPSEAAPNADGISFSAS